MIQLVYQSVTELDDGSSTFFVEIGRILETAIAHNVRHRITGVLGYAGGRFLQVLEGATADVEPLYARIMVDPRHRILHVPSRHPIATRTFGAWSMAYVGGRAGRLFEVIAREPDRSSHAYRAAIDALAALVG